MLLLGVVFLKKEKNIDVKIFFFIIFLIRNHIRMRYEKFYTTNPFEENSYDMIESLASYERRKCSQIYLFFLTEIRLNLPLFFLFKS